MTIIGLIDLDRYWEVAGFSIASLSLLDRLNVALSRMGANCIWIRSSRNQTEIRKLLIQSQRRNIQNIISSSSSAVDVWGKFDSVILAVPSFFAPDSDFKLDPAADKQVWLISSSNGKTAPVPMIGKFPIDALNVNSEFDGARYLEDLVMSGVDATEARTSMLIQSKDDADQATSMLWKSLTSPHDGVVDRFFNRPLGRPLAKALVATPVTPNQVTVFATLLGLFAAWMIHYGTWGKTVAGTLLFQLSAVIDCIDGDLARAGLRETKVGKWLDLVADQVVHIAVFLAIAWAVTNGVHAETTPAIGLGISAAVGALLSFFVVLWIMLSRKSSPLAQRWTDSMANRDFSVLTILLAVSGRLDLFLWMAGVGSHIFWIALIAVQITYNSKSSSRSGQER